jgi:hypothetical protein
MNSTLNLPKFYLFSGQRKINFSIRCPAFSSPSTKDAREKPFPAILRKIGEVRGYTPPKIGGWQGGKPQLTAKCIGTFSQ